ncbi:MAG TPA: hypothetical protein VND92_09750 [Vicinamibacterales bacterium]|nr:hypothetical protein [Vicinamibacterales bacterium]
MLNALSTVLTGLQQESTRLDQAANRIARDGAGGDLAGNMIDLMRATRGTQADVAAAKTIDQTIGTLFDRFA